MSGRAAQAVSARCGRRRALLPVTMHFSALITTTQSPTSAPGVNSGLCLPSRSFAISDDIRPSRSPSASTTYHFFAAIALSSALGIHVFCPGIIGVATGTPASMRTAAARLAGGAGSGEGSTYAQLSAKAEASMADSCRQLDRAPGKRNRPGSSFFLS